MNDPFPTVKKLAEETGASWPGYALAAKGTRIAEAKLRKALTQAGDSDRMLTGDASLVLFGSFARQEMVKGSDFDWALLVDGVVDNNHAKQAHKIKVAMENAGLTPPGGSGTFGNMVFSHDLVHQIGGASDSNANLTRRMLMLLESRPFSLSNSDSHSGPWENVMKNILERYFEEDVHFTPGKSGVPRFLLNDLVRYWRTICVDYAAKHREQDGKKWAARNAKLRFSRKLLFASGFAFCISCGLNPPGTRRRSLFSVDSMQNSAQVIERAMRFARTPPLEYLATFVDAYVKNKRRRKIVCEAIFGAYGRWLELWNTKKTRKALESMTHKDALKSDSLFDDVRTEGSSFASGLELLFFNHDRENHQDTLASTALEYIGF